VSDRFVTTGTVRDEATNLMHFYKAVIGYAVADFNFLHYAKSQNARMQTLVCNFQLPAATSLQAAFAEAV